METLCPMRGSNLSIYLIHSLLFLVKKMQQTRWKPPSGPLGPRTVLLKVQR